MRGEGGALSEMQRFYSVLIKSEVTPQGKERISEIYRVQLPGMPILGEGKPENQVTCLKLEVNDLA